MQRFKAYRLVAEGRGGVVEMALDETDPGDVVVRSRFASVNYKDALAALGRAKLVRKFPRVPGIDVFGEIAESADPRFARGDPVAVHGFGLGTDRDGGFAELVRVPGDFVLPLPAGLDPANAAAIGVAGYTAVLAIEALELNGLRPGAGPVAVNGATGGVASIGIDLLAQRGYRVTAISRKPDDGYLVALGAAEVKTPQALAVGDRPLEASLWAGALDSLGGAALGPLIRTARQDGVIASFGNAAGNALSTSVLPFILRGVRLIGINANSPMPLRRRIWGRLAAEMRPRQLARIAHPIPLSGLHEAFAALVDGTARGRFVVDFSRG